MPAGLDGNPNPLSSPARDYVLETLAGEIADLPRGPVLRVAIDGIDGAGKSTFADELGRRLTDRSVPIIRSSIDSFHRPRAERWQRGMLSDVGFYLDSHNFGALRAILLDPLSSDPPAPYRVAAFDEPSDDAVDAPFLEVEEGAVLLFDGLFLQRSELRTYWDYVIYLDGEARVSENRIARAVDGCPPGFAGFCRLAAWWALLGRYVGGFRLYVEECDPRTMADAVIDNNDILAPAVIRMD